MQLSLQTRLFKFRVHFSCCVLTFHTFELYPSVLLGIPTKVHFIKDQS